MARGLGRPIAATSANISGQPTLYNIEDVTKSFADRKNQPDLILDGGDLSVKKPSTIIKMTNKNIEVIRQGEAKIGIM